MAPRLSYTIVITIILKYISEMPSARIMLLVAQALLTDTHGPRIGPCPGLGACMPAVDTVLYATSGAFLK